MVLSPSTSSSSFSYTNHSVLINDDSEYMYKKRKRVQFQWHFTWKWIAYVNLSLWCVCLLVFFFPNFWIQCHAHTWETYIIASVIVCQNQPLRFKPKEMHKVKYIVYALCTIFSTAHCEKVVDTRYKMLSRVHCWRSLCDATYVRMCILVCARVKHRMQLIQWIKLG